MDDDLHARVTQYAAARSLALSSQHPFGFGNDGTLWKSSVPTVIKAFRHHQVYSTELACYLRLQEREVTEIRGFAIPGISDHDDELRVIEMDLVSPPYLLDFGKTYLDRKPDFSEEVWHDWAEQHAEMWDDRWPEVKRLLWRLESYGIYYVDPRPGNIRFAD
jgi:hypothetical protein